MSDTSRKALAEFIGSALLAATVVGSGIAAETLSPDDVGLQLLGGALGLAAAVPLYPGTKRLAEDLTRTGERTPVDLDPVEARP